MARSDTASQRRRWSWRKIVLLQLALIPLALLLTEGLYRAWLSFSGEPYDSVAASGKLAEIVSPLRQSIPQASARPTDEPAPNVVERTRRRTKRR
jgi:hypothetical protein